MPDNICNAKQLNQWLKTHPKEHNQALSLTEKILLKNNQQDSGLYPETLTVKGIELRLSYHFEPGHEADGVTVTIPQSLSQKFHDSDFERLVPGLLEEKIEFLLRSLPKRFRKNFVPIPQFAKACYEQVLAQKGSLIDIITKHLFKMTGTILPAEAWQELSLSDHFLMRIKIVDDKGKVLSQSRTLKQLDVKPKAIKNSSKKHSKIEALTYLEWPTEFQKQGVVHEAKTQIPVFFALEDANDKVQIRQFVSQKQAEKVHARGVCRLLALQLSPKIKYLKQKYHNKQKLSLACASLQNTDNLIEDACLASLQTVFGAKIPFTKQQFDDVLVLADKCLLESATSLLNDLTSVLQLRNSCLAQLDSLSKDLVDSKTDIKQQLEFLFQQGFCYRFGVEKIKDFKRYLKAIDIRIDKAQYNISKDIQSLDEINYWLEQIEIVAENNKIPSFEIDDLMWKLEEFRISLFAQGQKTQFPISAKRLEKYLDQLENQYI